jgi:hypothetical protein
MEDCSCVSVALYASGVKEANCLIKKVLEKDTLPQINSTRKGYHGKKDITKGVCHGFDTNGTETDGEGIAAKVCQGSKA